MAPPCGFRRQLDRLIMENVLPAGLAKHEWFTTCVRRTPYFRTRKCALICAARRIAEVRCSESRGVCQAMRVEDRAMSGPAPAHRIRRMSGRDPYEDHRVATPLELLFDLTFVVAFGVAASEFAHMLAEGHVGAGLAGFAFSTFAVCWAWINFTWFASAYDTDDWMYRVTDHGADGRRADPGAGHPAVLRVDRARRPRRQPSSWSPATS